MRRFADPPRLSIVIPTLNEARNLEILLPTIPREHEIVIVDGHSTDGTVEVATALVPSVTVVEQTRRGKGNALVCGFRAATGDIIVTLDADGSADPAEIPSFVGRLVGGADFAKGSRYCRGGGSADLTALRRLGNLGLNWMCNRALRTSFTDLCYGYNAFWRDILPLLGLPHPDLGTPASGGHVWGDGFEIETLLTVRAAMAGLRISEVPSYERLRVHGESNLSTFGDGFRVLTTIATERSAPAAAAVAG